MCQSSLPLPFPRRILIGRIGVAHADTEEHRPGRRRHIVLRIRRMKLRQEPFWLDRLPARRRPSFPRLRTHLDVRVAVVGGGLNAAQQQFAVVVSNAQPDVPATVSIEQDDTEPGEANDPVLVTRATVPPLSLTVFKLGPREVDGSPPGEYDTGTHTALTRAAYRIKTSVPVQIMALAAFSSRPTCGRRDAWPTLP